MSERARKSPYLRPPVATRFGKGVIAFAHVQAVNAASAGAEILGAACHRPDHKNAVPAQPRAFRPTGTPHPMKFLKNPIVQTALVVVGVIVVLGFLKPYTSKIPVIGQYLS